MTALRQTWTFDEMYTAFALTGLGGAKGPDDAAVAPLAAAMMAHLGDVHFFTRASEAAGAMAFGAPRDAVTHLAGPDHALQLVFTLPLRRPVPGRRGLDLQVYDPTYYVDFAFEGPDSVQLVGAPAGCAVAIHKPDPLAPDRQAAMTESFFNSLAPDTDVGASLADRISLRCR